MHTEKVRETTWEKQGKNGKRREKGENQVTRMLILVKWHSFNP
jgi:hypothetical protein